MLKSEMVATNGDLNWKHDITGHISVLPSSIEVILGKSYFILIFWGTDVSDAKQMYESCYYYYFL